MWPIDHKSNAVPVAPLRHPNDTTWTLNIKFVQKQHTERIQYLSQARNKFLHLETIINSLIHHNLYLHLLVFSAKGIILKLKHIHILQAVWL